ncbi:hypothetical protein [Gordonia humi]|uniref:Uncharacterized protein n=1 Tax=Gordonia humi TaxID=686429 RepID=A0A840EUC9_9ACTN|nr:hypothetical protein [Gordonia humi]
MTNGDPSDAENAVDPSVHWHVRRRELATLMNEFAAVRVSVDSSGNGDRLLVEDLESDDHVFLTPLELVSFCLASPDDRDDWLRVGSYRGARVDRSFGRSDRDRR